MRAGLAAGTLAALLAPGIGAAQDTCRTDTLTARFPIDWVGKPVQQVLVHTEGVAAPAPFDRLATAARMTTRSTVVLSDVDITPGEPLDSLRVQESVRRLRRSGLFTNVVLTGTRCGSEGVALTYRTQDAWSLRADVRFGRRQSRAALSDINVLGSGRSFGFQTDELDDRRAVNISYLDPWLLGSRYRGAALLRSYGDGRMWAWSARTSPQSALDPWRLLVSGMQLRRFSDDSTLGTRTDLTRRNLAAVATRTVVRTPTSVWALEFGAEQEQATLGVVRLSRGLGKSDVQRSFSAPLVGVELRSLTYGALDWLVPGQSLAEYPTGLEADVVIGRGPELHTSRPISHLDGWIGFTKSIGAGGAVTGDVWFGGYWNSDSVSNGSTRLALSYYQRAWRGLWTARLSYERIFNPDPDVFALTTLDPLLRSLAPRARLSEQATSATIERDFTVYSSKGLWGIQAAPFLTLADRRNTVPDVGVPDRLTRNAIIGLGLRRVFAQPAQAPLRIDVGRGIYRSSSIPDRWVAVVTVSPWLNAGRGRSGAREQR